MGYKIAGVDDDGNLTPRAMTKIATDRDVAIAEAIAAIDRGEIGPASGTTIRYVGADEPDTADWQVNELWFDLGGEA